MSDYLITIPAPFPLGQRHGVDSLTHHTNAVIRSLRLMRADLALLDKEAAQLGVSRSHFMRWCALQVAAELHKRRTGIKPEITL